MTVEILQEHRIQQLPLSVINKIAAGEVIERPASVVKELLENSLDAGATRIDLEVEAGGIELIRVVDNGRGFHPEDLELAFSNHATSKLQSADDLFSIHTMGFRGEALSSIGGIAQVSLQSRRHDDLAGAEITCHGGDLSPVKVWNGAAGSRIEVKHLFFNTPVRRKFLKSPGTEMGHVCEIFTRIALANPGLHLTLRHNNKLVYEVPGSSSLLHRIGLFFGEEVRTKLYEVDHRHGERHLYGFIADPACDRGTAKSQYLFLNGRWIRDRSLGHAVQEAYRGLLMTGRYAVSYLFLDVPADSVDVNVHPTKAEVRFAEGQALFSMVLATLRNRLSRENLTAKLKAPTAPTGTMTPTTPTGFMTPRSDESTPSLFSKPGFPTFQKRPLPDPPARRDPLPIEPKDTYVDPTPSAPVPVAAPSEQELIPWDLPETPTSLSTPTSSEEAESTPVPPPPVLEIDPKAIQLHNAYLVLETSEGMLVIDQHALHERVLFEQFKERFQRGELEVQKLLIPEPIELSAELAAKALEQRTALAELGLGIEDFGGGTLLVTSYPAILGKTPPTDILKSILDHIHAHDRLPPRAVLLEEMMSLLACHSAVRSGDPLTPEEISALVKMRHLAVDAHHCPHGRPTALLFTRHELDKQFKRI